MTTRTLVLLICACSAAASAGEDVVLDFGRDLRADLVEARHFTYRVEGADAAGVLRLARTPSKEWARFYVRAPQGHWDWSAYDSLVLDVTNAGTDRAACAWRVENAEPTDERGWRRRFGRLGPGDTLSLRIDVNLDAARDARGAEIRLIGMRSYPWGRSGRMTLAPFDPTRVARIHFHTYASRRPQAFVLSSVRGSRRRAWALPQHKPFFPFVDRFGQYMDRDWPGKTHSLADMTRCARAEAADLAAHPRPSTWDRYGGWTAGPQLEATGHFRVQRHQGKWWLVDPDGRLFFSHGIAAVRIAGEFTPVDDRRHYFAELPDRGDPAFGRFYKRLKTSLECYSSRRPLCFNFTDANLLRKYGATWPDTFIDLCHRRLASWGHNTLGNWTTDVIHQYEKRRTSYTPAGSMRGVKPLRGWADGKRFIDVFDPTFDAALRRLSKQVASTADDPYCIGYFVHNEMNWDHDVIPLATLNSPADQPAKAAFVDMLRGRYGQIAALNTQWGAKHGSWDAVLQCTEPPEPKTARGDFDAFLSLFAERYFSKVRAAVKAGSPHTLYLGCRFNTFNRIPASAAAKYCDVVSYNLYRTPEQAAHFEFPGRADAALIVGEWHFGALDRGQCDYGIRQVASQGERGRSYLAYMKAALRHRQIVGAHWFRYKDQSFTGRHADGANAQNGFLDICDTPYAETVAAAREVGEHLYEWRAPE